MCIAQKLFTFQFVMLFLYVVLYIDLACSVKVKVVSSVTYWEKLMNVSKAQSLCFEGEFLKNNKECNDYNITNFHKNLFRALTMYRDDSSIYQGTQCSRSLQVKKAGM